MSRHFFIAHQFFRTRNNNDCRLSHFFRGHRGRCVHSFGRRPRRIELLACGAGLVSGFAAAWLATVSSRKLGAKGDWWRMMAVGRALLTSEDQNHFFRQYVAFWPVMCLFVAKKFATAAVALLPVLLTFVCLAPWASGFWESHASHIEFAPPQHLVVEHFGKTLHLQPNRCTIPTGADLDGPAVISIPEGRLYCAQLTYKQATSSNWFERGLLSLLGFEMLEWERPGHVEGPRLLVRPSCDDNNVLWPYLSDWEFDFFVAVCIASVAGTLVARSRA